MITKEPSVSLVDLVLCLSDAVDLVSPELSNHHVRVAYIAFSIARELKYPDAKQVEIAMAGLLHDIGGLSLQSRLDAVDEVGDLRKHGELAFALLNTFEPLSSIATTIRYHMLPWPLIVEAEATGSTIPLDSHIIYIADRVAVLFDPKQSPLGQVKKIKTSIAERSGTVFNKGLVEALLSVADKEYFWLDLATSGLGLTIADLLAGSTVHLGLDRLVNISKLFSSVIDFRSHYTATHSTSVAYLAKNLGRLAGFSARECLMLEAAGYLHDLGKLGVPAEILEKPGKLTPDEFDVIRGHTFYSYRILQRLKELDTINQWVSYHHERLDGAGYPFHISGSDLPLGSRIMAVADVTSGITEDRPYRKAMDYKDAIKVLTSMAARSALDGDIVQLMTSNVGEIDHVQRTARELASIAYQNSIQTDVLANRHS